MKGVLYDSGMGALIDKEQAHRLIDQLGEDSTWDDLIEAIVVRLAIDAGIRDFEQGRTISHEEVLRRVDRAP